MSQIRKLSSALLILFSTTVIGQTGSIKGLIKTSDGQPAEFVIVGLKGTGKGASTGAHGEYEIKRVAPGNYTLVTSNIGLEKTEQQIEVKAGETTNVQEIILKENTMQLKAVTISADRTKRYNYTISSISMRTETKLIETPQSVQIIGKDVIQDQQARTFKEVIKNVAGVSSVSPFNEFIFRGFDDWYSTMYNGVNGEYFSPVVQIPTFNFEEVEFLKGPASVLYSSGRPGGLININTKKPLNYKRYEVNLTFGSWNEKILSLDATGAISKNKKLCFRFVSTGTYVERFRDFAKTKSIFITPSLSYKFNDKSVLQIEYNYFYQNLAPGLDDGTIVKMKADSTWDWRGMSLNFSAQSPKDKVIDRGHSVDISFIHQFNDRIKLTFINRYINSYNEAHYHYVNYHDPIYVNDTLKRIYAVWNSSSHYYQSSLFTSFKFKTWKMKHELLVGVDYSHQVNNSHSYGSDAPAFNINFPDYSLDDTADYSFFERHKNYSSDASQTTGGYIQDQIEVNKYIKLSGGFRYDDFGSYHKYSYHDFMTDSLQHWDGDTIKDHAIVPKAGIVINPWKNIAFYGSYSESFEPQSTNSPLEGGPFPPTKGKTWEVGYKGDYIKDKLSTSLALYSIHYVNILLQDPSDSLGRRLMVIKGMKSRGVEVSAQGNITNDLQLIVNFAFNKVAYYDRTSAWQKSDRQYDTPNIIMGAFFSYKFSRTRLKGLSLNAGVHHESDRVASWFNQKFVTPSYTYYDAGLGYIRNKITVNFNLYNLFNTKYITGGLVTGLVYPGTPRSFRVSLNYIF